MVSERDILKTINDNIQLSTEEKETTLDMLKSFFGGSLVAMLSHLIKNYDISMCPNQRVNREVGIMDFLELASRRYEPTDNYDPFSGNMRVGIYDFVSACVNEYYFDRVDHESISPALEEDYDHYLDILLNVLTTIQGIVHEHIIDIVNTRNPKVVSAPVRVRHFDSNLKIPMLTIEIYEDGADITY